MITKRIIPCLDVRDGRVVKGVNFAHLADVNSPVELAEYYTASGADELVFYDITASAEGRALFTDILCETAKRVFIPLTVGGGVRTLEDVRRLLNAGADKTSFNSAAIANPQVIRDAADRYGSQCIVVAIDAKRRTAPEDIAARGEGWDVYSHGGRKNTGLDALQWACQMANYGAGEILLTSMDRDGTKAGFDLELTRAVSDALTIPIIASGGVGTLDHLADGVQQGEAVVGEAATHHAHEGAMIAPADVFEHADADHLVEFRLWFEVEPVLQADFDAALQPSGAHALGGEVKLVLR